MRCHYLFWAAVLSGLVATSAHAATINWVGGGANDNWSTGANWSPADTNPAGDALFYDVSVAIPPGTVNGIVDASYTVASMKFDNASFATSGDRLYTVQIPSGTTLTVSGAVEVGRYWVSWPASPFGNNKRVTVEFSGGGQMVVNGALTVRNAGPDAWVPAKLDVSGLSQFTVDTTGNIHIGGTNNGAGELVLSPDSVLRAAGIYVPGIQNWAGQNMLSSLYLGQQNALDANVIYVGAYGLKGQMLFQSGLTDPVVTIRDRAGTGAADLRIGDMAANRRPVVGTVDFTGGTVDAQLDELRMGILDLQNTTSGQAVLHPAAGTLSMSAGTITANTVVLGLAVDGSDPNRNWTEGTLNLQGGGFAAGTITLADDDAPLHDRVRGTINFSGGTLSAGTIQKGDGNGQAIFNWTGGTLHVDHFLGLDLVQNNTDSQSILAPGRSIGTTAVDGDYQMNAGILQIEIDPTIPANDLVTVTGQATLNGQLEVVLLDPDVPLGASFDVLTASLGIIDNLTLVGDQAGAHAWAVQLLGPPGGAQILRLTAVPEPSTLLLAALGLLGLVVGRRRRKRQPMGR